jgi:hypothetical protein
VPAKLARAEIFFKIIKNRISHHEQCTLRRNCIFATPNFEPGVTMNDQKPPRSAQRFSPFVIMRSRYSSPDAQAKGNSRGYRRNPSSAAPRQEEERETHSRPQFEMCACTRRRTQQVGLEVNGAL